MNKRKKKPSAAKVLKQSTLTSLIFLFAWILFQLADHFQLPQPTKIPGSQDAVELYSNQTKDDLTQLYQQAILQANKSITLVIYSLTDETIIQSLQKRGAEGIPVHIVCDAQASKGISRRLPNATIVNRSGNGLMHQKILIIDEEYLWMGSANLTFSSLNIHGNLVFGLHHPPLAQALEKRSKSMDEEGGVEPLLHQETTAGPQYLELWILPDDQKAVSRMVELFRSAKKSIQVAMFTWTRIDFSEELIAAARRGVKVEVVLDRNQGMGTGKKVAHLLKENGIPTNLHTSQGLLHHKFAYIDQKILINGSANWTKRAFDKNDDYFIILDPLTENQQTKMEALFKTILKNSQPVEYD